jgi:hypothetical protein
MIPRIDSAYNLFEFGHLTGALLQKDIENQWSYINSDETTPTQNKELLNSYSTMTSYNSMDIAENPTTKEPFIANEFF